MIIQQNQNKTLNFLANILCVHVRKSDEMYASPTWCTHAKKKTRLKWPWPAFDFTQRSLHRAWPPMRSPWFLPKKSSHKFAVVFCKRYACFFLGGGVGMARDRFELKITRVALFEFVSATCDCEVTDSFVGNPSTSTASGTASNLWSSHAWPDAFLRKSSWLQVEIVTRKRAG